MVKLLVALYMMNYIRLTTRLFRMVRALFSMQLLSKMCIELYFFTINNLIGLNDVESAPPIYRYSVNFISFSSSALNSFYRFDEGVCMFSQGFYSGFVGSSH